MTELTDREIEIRCAKECGMTTIIRRNGTAYVTDFFNRAGDCVNSYWHGNVEPDPSKAIELFATDFLTDGNACDMLLVEADRRGGGVYGK